MNWISKLERKYGHLAIHGIMRYLIVLQVVGYLIIMMSPVFYTEYLLLDASAILKGQVWRIFTFLIEPSSKSNILFFMISLYFYYFLGSTLESVWGTFRFNLYLLSGVLFHVIAALLVYFIVGISLPLGTSYLYLSLFFAFTFSFPETEFRLFYILPVKAKYLGMLNGAFFAFTILQGILPSYTESIAGPLYQANALGAAISILNFMIFFFSSRKFKANSPAQRKRKKKFTSEIKKSTRAKQQYENGALHKCAICGRTELDDRSLEFRYCSKCKGNYEYCQEHLFTHEHKK